MSPRDRVALRQVVEALANALQTATGLATHVRRETHELAEETAALEAAIGRAVVALRRLQPRRGRGRS
jgi:hypothetical protein